MRSTDTDALLAEAVNAARKQPEQGTRFGTLLSWDPSTGNNTVQVGTSVLEDLSFITSGSIAMAPGDVVAILRHEDTYYISGVVRNAGTGSLQTRAARVPNTTKETTTSTSFTDLDTVGPTVEDVYIGSNRQCICLMQAYMEVPGGDAGQMTVAVSGASTISAGDLIINSSVLGTVGAPTTSDVQGTVMSVGLITADDGLNEGLNTFTAKYRSRLGNTVGFSVRSIVVIPY